MAVPMPLMFLGQDVRQFRVSQKASAGGQVALTVGGAVDGLVMAVVELLLEAPAEEILASSVGKQGTWLGVAIRAAEEILALSVGKQGTWLGTALKAVGEILPLSMMKTASKVETVQFGGTPFVGLWRNASGTVMCSFFMVSLSSHTCVRSPICVYVMLRSERNQVYVNCN